MKFLHAADIHIDSPLRGLDAVADAPVERLRRATREAFQNLVDLATEQEVDFVVLAGDLFDGRWLDAATGVWTAGQLRRLDRQQVPVFLIRGNHDAISQLPGTIRWPDNVREFEVERPQTIVLEQLGVALHGQGFAHREVTDDLASGYPRAVDGLFNIGVLHTSLTGHPQHDRYAPTTVETLIARGYDYWALGHIHHRQVVRERQPCIAFPGNTQGRHINESGPKGCLIATVEDRTLLDVSFHAADALRWERAEVRLRAEDRLDDMFGQTEAALVARLEQAEGRFVAARVVVSGAADAHRHLIHDEDRQEAEAEIRRLAEDLGDVWIEKVRFETAPALDRDALRGGGHLVGDLLRLIDEIRADDEALVQFADCLDPLTKKASLELKQAGVGVRDLEQLRGWLQEAETTLVSRLWETDE